MENHKVLSRYRNATSAIKLSVFGNLFLGLFKLAGGILGNSLAVVADSIDTLSDVFVSLVVWIGLRIGIMPKDRHHHFGHGDVEPIAGLIISLILVVIGVEFAKYTLDRVMSGAVYVPETIALVVMVVSSVAKYWMYRFTIKAGKETNSTALITNAYNFKGDFYRSAAILIGVYAAGYIPLVDSGMGFVVSLWIIYTGISQGRSNILSIMGTVPSQESLKEIREITKSIKGVRGIHDLRVHYIGVYAFANLHIRVDPRLTISEAHKIATDVENKIKNKMESMTSVTVHTEP